jgi:hypothetical protein
MHVLFFLYAFMAFPRHMIKEGKRGRGKGEREGERHGEGEEERLREERKRKPIFLLL